MTHRVFQRTGKVGGQTHSKIGENVTPFAMDELNEARALFGMVGSEELQLGCEHSAHDFVNVGGVGQDKLLTVVNADGVPGCDEVGSAAPDDGGFNLLSGHGRQSANGESLEQAA